jgi:hypothetical protein
VLRIAAVGGGDDVRACSHLTWRVAHRAARLARRGSRAERATSAVAKGAAAAAREAHRAGEMALRAVARVAHRDRATCQAIHRHRRRIGPDKFGALHGWGTRPRLVP